MKTHTALSTLLLAAVLVPAAACDKSDKKDSPAAETKASDTTGSASGSASAVASASGSAAAATAGTGAASASGAGTASGSASSGTAAATTDTGPGLTLLDAGADPKFLLKYQAPAGTKQTMEMAIDLSMTTPMGPMTMPEMIMDADVQVASVGTDGAMTNKMKFTNIDAKDTKDSTAGMADKVKPQLQKMKGIAMTMTIEPSGKVRDFKLDASTDPAMAQMMGQTQTSIDQMVAQLPTDKVGKGAKWRIKQTVEQQGMKIDQDVVYELVDVTATTAHLKGVGTMTAGQQDINQGGMTATLKSLSGTANTDMTIDFTKVVPKISGDVSMKMSVEAMGQAADVSMQTHMSISAK